MTELNKKMQFDIPSIIARCFDECKEAGYIESVVAVKAGVHSDVDSIVNPTAIAEHISKTLIGELLEFEIMRRLAPIYREDERIKRDLQLIEAEHVRHANLAGLRIDPGVMPEPPQMEPEKS